MERPGQNYSCSALRSSAVLMPTLHKEEQRAARKARKGKKGGGVEGREKKSQKQPEAWFLLEKQLILYVIGNQAHRGPL